MKERKNERGKDREREKEREGDGHSYAYAPRNLIYTPRKYRTIPMVDFLDTLK